MLTYKYIFCQVKLKTYTKVQNAKKKNKKKKINK